MERALSWLRSPGALRVLDALLVLAVFVVGLAGHEAARTNSEIEAAPLSVAAALFAGMAATVLIWRRSRPLVTLGVLVVVAMVAAGVVAPGLYPAQAGVELMIVCFAIGAWSTRSRRALVVTGLVMLGVFAGARGDGSGVLQAGAFSLALVGFPLVAGYAARSRRLYVEEVERRLVHAERDRDAQARRAIEEERTRIARELHDVVAHHVSLIGVQAGAARRALERSPSTTQAALVAIESSSRDAVGEMRQLLDVLRPVDGRQSCEPQPGLGSLPALVGRWRAAGFDIACDTRGLDADLSPTLSLSCYRMVEEALTNVARHSAARSADVAVLVGGDVVTIAVRDPGPALAASGAVEAAGGRGLVGMAERAVLFGGRMTSGPTSDGGFLIEAILPQRPS
jgi:signal transduction histidine kinase